MHKIVMLASGDASPCEIEHALNQLDHDEWMVISVLRGDHGWFAVLTNQDMASDTFGRARERWEARQERPA